MSGESINITLAPEESPITVTVTPQQPISVNFYDIAVPDPRVIEARDAAVEAKLQAEEAQDAAEEAAANAADAATAAVASETAARIAADNILQGNIDTEATARQSADALLIPLSQIASANGVASLDSAGKVPLAQLPSSIMEYQGVYNASTNSPSLSDYASGAAAGDNIGNVYRVSVAGSQDFGSGSITFEVGDYVILNALGKWEKSDTTDAVASVNGFTGVVTVTVDSTSGTETTKSPSVAATKSLVTAHTGLTSAHGVSGNIVGTTDTQTLTNKTIVTASNTITTAASGNLTATELNAALAQLASLIVGASDLVVKSKTAAYTVLNSDGVVFGDATSAAFTLTLPTAASITGRQIRFKKTDSSANKVTLDGNGSETIDGSLTYDLWLQNQAVTIVSDGTNWRLI